MRPANAALGCVKSGRTNVFHLPVVGSAYVTAKDMSAFWVALFDGRLLSNDLVAAMVESVSQAPEQKMRHGRGFWLAPEGDEVVLEGMDAGVSAFSSFDPKTGRGYTVLSNTSSGTWPIIRHLENDSHSFGC